MVQDAVIEVPFENQTIIVFISFYQNYHSCEINWELFLFTEL